MNEKYQNFKQEELEFNNQRNITTFLSRIGMLEAKVNKCEMEIMNVEDNIRRKQTPNLM